ncbi:hypothetical protein BJ546DRAFT_189125 [Cryomyces antarcticus]
MQRLTFFEPEANRRRLYERQSSTTTTSDVRHIFTLCLLHIPLGTCQCPPKNTYVCTHVLLLSAGIFSSSSPCGQAVHQLKPFISFLNSSTAGHISTRRLRGKPRACTSFQTVKISFVSLCLRTARSLLTSLPRTDCVNGRAGRTRWRRCGWYLIAAPIVSIGASCGCLVDAVP